MPKSLNNSTNLKRRGRMEALKQFKCCQNPNCKKEFTEEERKAGCVLCKNCAVEEAKKVVYTPRKKTFKRTASKDPLYRRYDKDDSIIDFSRVDSQWRY